ADRTIDLEMELASCIPGGPAEQFLEHFGLGIMVARSGVRWAGLQIACRAVEPPSVAPLSSLRSLEPRSLLCGRQVLEVVRDSRVQLSSRDGLGLHHMTRWLGEIGAWRLRAARTRAGEEFLGFRSALPPELAAGPGAAALRQPEQCPALSPAGETQSA